MAKQCLIDESLRRKSLTCMKNVSLLFAPNKFDTIPLPSSSTFPHSRPTFGSSSSARSGHPSVSALIPREKLPEIWFWTETTTTKKMPSATSPSSPSPLPKEPKLLGRHKAPKGKRGKERRGKTSQELKFAGERKGRKIETGKKGNFSILN